MITRRKLIATSMTRSNQSPDAVTLSGQYNVQKKKSSRPSSSSQAYSNSNNTCRKKASPADSIVSNATAGSGFGSALASTTGSSSIATLDTLTSSSISSSKEMIHSRDIASKDVLCGRDKKKHSHPGNRRFLQIIEMNRETYQTLPSKEDKTQFSNHLLSTIRSCGVKFLKEADGEKIQQDDRKQSKADTTHEENEQQVANESKGIKNPNNNHGSPLNQPKGILEEWWYDVGNVFAREKISHALRSARDPNRPRTRRKRKHTEFKATPEGDAMFQATLEDQQKVFRSMIEREAKGEEIVELFGLDSSDSDSN